MAWIGLESPMLPYMEKYLIPKTALGLTGKYRVKYYLNDQAWQNLAVYY